MKSLYILFFVITMVILYVPDLYGASNCGDEWVDPDPLSKIDCVRASKLVKKEARKPSQETEDCLKIEETLAVKQQLNLCNQSLSNCSKQLNDLKHNLSSALSHKESSPDGSVQKQECMQDKLYMKRLVNILLTVSNLNEDMPQNLDTHLYITVTLEQLKVLQWFSKGSHNVTLQELDHVMSSVLLSSKSNIFLEEYIPWSTVADFCQSRKMIFALVLVSLLVVLMWKILRGHSVFRILTLFVISLFIISYVLTYCRMYKQAEIKQYAALKANTGVPAECRQLSELRWWESILQAFSSNFNHPLQCQKYYETVMIDPLLEVTPTLVLSETLAGFFLHPSGMLGSAIGDFSKNILGNLPFGYNVVVLLSSFVLLAAVIIALSGGVARLPFYMGGLEFSGRRPQERMIAAPQKSQVKEQVEQSSECSVMKEVTRSNLMHSVDSTDTRLVIMNIPVQRFLSAEGIAMVHRDTLEEVQLSFTEKMCIYCASEESDQSGTAYVTCLSGCCKSQLSSHKAVLQDETVTSGCGCGCINQLLRENQKEELQLRKTTGTCISKGGHSQIQGTEVTNKHTEGVRQEDETEKLTSANNDALCDCREPGTVSSCNVLESAIEEDMNRRRSSSVDISDEETGFVKL